jgi:AcrR family transcriptional regulator
MEMVKRSGGLTRDDWVETALAALSSGGMAAVAVEPIAKQLDATKGSFYWHFRNRDELVDAVAQLWEQRYVTDAITRLSEVTDPRERLERLLAVAVTPGTGRIDLALTEAAQADERLADRVRRVHEHRVDFLASIYEELGLPPVDARQLAVLGLLAQAGMAVVQATAPGLIPADDELATLKSFLVPGPA